MRRLASLALAFPLIAPILAAGAARAGEARCWLDHGAVVVAASFGDMAGDFILDASTPTNQLHVTRAEEDGIAGPSARAALVLAGERVEDLDMAVADLDARSAGLVTSINGVIGADVLRRFVLQIDFAPCRIRLYRRAPPPMTGAVRLRVREAAGVPAVAATISDGHQSRAGLFAINTASAVSEIAEATLSRQPPADGDPPIRLRALAVAARLFEQTPAGVTPGTPAALQGSIGTAVWSHWRLRLDLRRGWLELAPRRGLVADVPPDAAIAGVEKPGEDEQEDHHR
jgi:hypothetical protein